jgi:hypothetical protein
VPFLDVLEDEVEELKVLLEDWGKGQEKEMKFYGRDIISAGGIGNLIMI